MHLLHPNRALPALTQLELCLAAIRNACSMLQSRCLTPIWPIWAPGHPPILAARGPTAVAPLSCLYLRQALLRACMGREAGCRQPGVRYDVMMAKMSHAETFTLSRTYPRPLPPSFLPPSLRATSLCHGFPAISTPCSQTNRQTSCAPQSRCAARYARWLCGRRTCGSRKWKRRLPSRTAGNGSRWSLRLCTSSATAKVWLLSALSLPLPRLFQLHSRLPSRPLPATLSSFLSLSVGEGMVCVPGSRDTCISGVKKSIRKGAVLR